MILTIDILLSFFLKNLKPHSFFKLCLLKKFEKLCPLKIEKWYFLIYNILKI